LDEEAGEMLDEQTGRLLGAGNKIGSNRKQDASFVPNQSQTNFKYDNGGGASRFFYCAKASSCERNAGLEGMPTKETHRNGAGIGEGKHPEAPAKDKNNHPTVKPLKLMEYLIKLIMPPKDGILLDPFAGSGTTLLAAQNLGYQAIGIEKEKEYCEIAEARLKHGSEQMRLNL
jgi:DNA modification methylase